MSQYTYIVHFALVKDQNRLNEIITNGDEKFPGLNSAEAIISINVDYQHEGLIVFWRERKWLSSDAEAAERQ